MLNSFLYEIVLWAAALLSLPKLLYNYWFRGKYRQSLGKRLGLNFPLIRRKDRFVIWVHAVSIGETKAVSSLVKQIKSHSKHALIIVSSITETGHAEAKRCIPFADHHVYLPFDLSCIIKPIVNYVKPNLVIISETDFWYNFLKQCKKVNACITLVNGKISKRSMQRFEKMRYFSSHLFSTIDFACVQSQHYQARFEVVGIPKEKIKITGNLKFDDEYPQLTQEQHQEWKKQLRIGKDDPVCVIGSSHDPEEKLLLDQMHKVWESLPQLKVIIVPRHPERFNEVAALLHKEQIPYIRFSRLDHSSGQAKVILLDAMGFLRKCYQLADVAVVAGSYTVKVGGHNILEPAWYGVPVIFGPFMHAQPELCELIKEYEAGIQINIEDFSNTILELFQNSERRQEIGKNGLRMLSDINGATKRTFQVLKPTLAK